MWLFVSLTTLLFGLNTENDETVHVIGSLSFIFAGVVAIHRWYRKKRFFELDKATVLICLIIPAASFSALALDMRLDLMPQTLAFLLCALSARALTIANGIESNVRLFVYASCAIVFATLVFEFDLLIESLSFAVNSFGTRVRFSPFNNHPNLTGHIFGVACICSSIYVFWHKRNRDIVWYLAIIASIASSAMIAAASSRGATIAAFFGIASVYVAHLLQNKDKWRLLTINALIGSVVFILLLSVNTKITIEYFSELFELNSTYRGIGSGLTGRIDNWPVIIRLSLETFSGTMIGHGIRSWDGSLLRIATDSSYVNFLWEFGVFITLAIIALLLRKIHFTVAFSRSLVLDLYLAILVFVAVESIVARYMLGIGNPASLIVLVVLLTPDHLLRPNTTFAAE